MKKAGIYYFTLTDEKCNWLSLTDNNFESLMPVCDKEVVKSRAIINEFKQ